MLWNNKNILSIGSGKGGVGKSCFAANAGVLVGTTGKKVVLVDADLVGANLHTILGLKTIDKTIDDFIQKRISNLEDALLDTPFANVKLLSSKYTMLALDDPLAKERLKLTSDIKKLNANVIIFDTVVSSYTRAIDFFSRAAQGIIIVEPNPLSLENAFSFVKSLLMRSLLRLFYDDKQLQQHIMQISDPKTSGKYPSMNEILAVIEKEHPAKTKQFKTLFETNDSQLFLVLNRVTNSRQQLFADNFVKIVKRYLSINISFVGSLPEERMMVDCVVQRTPLVIKYPQSAYTKALEEIILKLFI